MSGLSQYIVYLLPVAALALIFYFFLYYLALYFYNPLLPQPNKLPEWR